MVFKYKEETVTQKYVCGFTCDSCNKEYGEQDWADLQECLTYRNTGGYGSVFGDGAEMELVLCQHCVKDLLGKYIRFTNLEGEE